VKEKTIRLGSIAVSYVHGNGRAYVKTELRMGNGTLVTEKRRLPTPMSDENVPDEIGRQARCVVDLLTAIAHDMIFSKSYPED